MQNVINFKKYCQPTCPDIPNDLITFKDFAAKYGMSKSYLYELCHTQKIKRYKFGKYKISENETLKAMSGG